MSEYLNDKAADKADEILDKLKGRNCSNCDSYDEKHKDCRANSNVLRDEVTDVNRPLCNLICWVGKHEQA